MYGITLYIVSEKYGNHVKPIPFHSGAQQVPTESKLRPKGFREQAGASGRVQGNPEYKRGQKQMQSNLDQLEFQIEGKSH